MIAYYLEKIREFYVVTLTIHIVDFLLRFYLIQLNEKTKKKKN